MPTQKIRHQRNKNNTLYSPLKLAIIHFHLTNAVSEWYSKVVNEEVVIGLVNTFYKLHVQR